MRQYLLDSGVLSAYMRGRPGALSLARGWVGADEASTSIVCVGEAAEYLKSYSNYLTRWQAFRTLLVRVYPFPITYAVCQRYADLRRALRPPYGPGLIGDIDTLIAATAIEHTLTLVTMDSDFNRVPGLTLQLVSSAAMRSQAP